MKNLKYLTVDNCIKHGDPGFVSRLLADRCSFPSSFRTAPLSGRLWPQMLIRLKLKKNKIIENMYPQCETEALRVEGTLKLFRTTVIGTLFGNGLRWPQVDLYANQERLISKAVFYEIPRTFSGNPTNWYYSYRAMAHLSGFMSVLVSIVSSESFLGHPTSSGFKFHRVCWVFLQFFYSAPPKKPS